MCVYLWQKQCHDTLLRKCGGLSVCVYICCIHHSIKYGMRSGNGQSPVLDALSIPQMLSFISETFFLFSWMLYSTMSDAGAKTTVKKIGQSLEAPAGLLNQNLVVFEVVVALLCRLICFCYHCRSWYCCCLTWNIPELSHQPRAMPVSTHWSKSMVGFVWKIFWAW